jgi:hypothetical protein
MDVFIHSSIRRNFAELPGPGRIIKNIGKGNIDYLFAS